MPEDYFQAMHPIDKSMEALRSIYQGLATMYEKPSGALTTDKPMRFDVEGRETPVPYQRSMPMTETLMDWLGLTAGGRGGVVYRGGEAAEEALQRVRTPLTKEWRKLPHVKEGLAKARKTLQESPKEVVDFTQATPYTSIAQTGDYPMFNQYARIPGTNELVQTYSGTWRPVREGGVLEVLRGGKNVTLNPTESKMYLDALMNAFKKIGVEKMVTSPISKSRMRHFGKTGGKDLTQFYDEIMPEGPLTRFGRLPEHLDVREWQ